MSDELELWRITDVMSYKLDLWTLWRIASDARRLKRGYEKIVEKELVKRSLQLPRPVLVRPVEACDKFRKNPDLYIQCLYVMYHAGGEREWRGQWYG